MKELSYKETDKAMNLRQSLGLYVCMCSFSQIHLDQILKSYVPLISDFPSISVIFEEVKCLLQMFPRASHFLTSDS